MTSLAMCLVSTMGLERKNVPGYGEVWTTARVIDRETGALIVDLLRETSSRS